MGSTIDSQSCFKLNNMYSQYISYVHSLTSCFVYDFQTLNLNMYTSTISIHPYSYLIESRKIRSLFVSMVTVLPCQLSSPLPSSLFFTMGFHCRAFYTNRKQSEHRSLTSHSTVNCFMPVCRTPGCSGGICPVVWLIWKPSGKDGCVLKLMTKWEAKTGPETVGNI